jgi:flagellar biosynthesis protein FlhF
MQLETFRSTSLAKAMADVRHTLGNDAVLIRTQVVGPDHVEVVAAAADELDRFRRVIEPAPIRSLTPGAASSAGGRGAPRVIALVGPPGAGKTTAISKLASSRHAFRDLRVGLVTIDSYRAGAIDELNLFAEIAGLPLEVAYGRRDVPGILQRLAYVDVILVDTPGRGSKAGPDQWRWREILWKLEADETHLVLPAAVRSDVATAMTRLFEVATGFTHLLPSRVDELVDDAGLAELASTVARPARWLATGQRVPDDLGPATPRILSALGFAVPGQGGPGGTTASETRRVS